MPVPQRHSTRTRRASTLGLLALAVSVSAASATPATPAVAAATPATTSATVPTTVRTAAPLKTAPLTVPVLRVSDGDTIVVRLGKATAKVRLIGIDTPELSPRQCYATQASARTSALVKGRRVTLRADATQGNLDRYGRLLRHVSVSNRSVAQLLIEGGYGREFTYARPYAGRTAYLAAQKRARAAHRGLWGACPLPGKAPVVTPRPAPVVTNGCRIKGNISSTGVKIYHVPGSRSYAATVITPSKGERWFCSEAQAVNARWRKARD